MSETETKKTKPGSHQLPSSDETTYVVGHSSGEIKFKTDENGRYTPKNEVEAWALKELGAKEVSE